MMNDRGENIVVAGEAGPSKTTFFPPHPKADPAEYIGFGCTPSEFSRITIVEDLPEFSLRKT